MRTFFAALGAAIGGITAFVWVMLHNKPRYRTEPKKPAVFWYYPDEEAWLKYSRPGKDERN